MKYVKLILIVVSTIGLYELAKYVTEQLTIISEANDDIDTEEM